jgi:hypothetical protein
MPKKNPTGAGIAETEAVGPKAEEPSGKPQGGARKRGGRASVPLPLPPSPSAGSLLAAALEAARNDTR